MTSYKLPFPKETRVWTTQGNNNTAPGASHAPGTEAAYAFDFSLAPGDADEGEIIVAATGGVVAQIREDTPDYVTGYAGRGRGNYLLISHGDGTCDIYMHLKQGSISEFGLEPGTPIVRGQEIARVGKTGFCFGAHLHFQRQSCGSSSCSIPCVVTDYFRQSVPITFADVPGDGIPRQGVSYTSGNELEEVPLTLEQALRDITAQRIEAIVRPARAMLAVAQRENLGAALSAVLRIATPYGDQRLVQVFEGDTLTVPATPPILEANVRRMGQLLVQNPGDPWGQTLWAHTYANAGLTFQSRWASHQFVLRQLATNALGSPLGGGTTNGVHMQSIGSALYEAEVYARDTIYWIAGVWGNVLRLSELDQDSTLKDWLEGITEQRVEDALSPARALQGSARQANLGSPLSGVRQLLAPSGERFFIQVFEGDTLFVSTTPPVVEGSVGSMRDLLVANPNDSLGRAFWEHTYAHVGVTFQPRWASHQFALRQLATSSLGAPLGGGTTNGVHVRTIDGIRYEIEVYCKDTIYWIPPDWGTILRMSEL